MMLFRDFSYAVYTAPGVAEECLRLQDDYGVDVNILLFCAYTAAVAQVTLSADDIADIDRDVAAIRDGVVAPLRACRRSMKEGLSALHGERADAAEDLRRQVKAIELAAEYLEQDCLVAWLARSGREGQTSGEPKHNITVLLSGHGRNGRPAPYPEKLARAALVCA